MTNEPPKLSKDDAVQILSQLYDERVGHGRAKRMITVAGEEEGLELIARQLASTFNFQSGLGKIAEDHFESFAHRMEPAIGRSKTLDRALADTKQSNNDVDEKRAKFQTACDTLGLTIK